MICAHDVFYGKSLPLVILLPTDLYEVTLTAVSAYLFVMSNHFPEHLQGCVEIKVLAHQLKLAPASWDGRAVTISDLNKLDHGLMVFQFLLQSQLPFSSKGEHMIKSLWKFREDLACHRAIAYIS